MPRSDAVWGIDIGQCALKALRCRPHEDGTRVVADAFDYIEYPQILSQPGADPAELIHEALTLFLSRNSVRNDRVAISVPGQAGLARFIKLPPVEAKKIPDIVRYEAKQQIPFNLDEVIWDYQRMGGGAESDGFALETEIGLFALKRDQVFQAVHPFQQAGIDVDLVQLTPLSLYNFALFDQLPELKPDEFDPENPPPSVVILSLGTDASDLVITNGYRVWQRSIPVGGNHFTKALVKELKLTFAKAEHLKRNATAAQDPKAVFQAMRPVFNDLLTEVQRSIGYFGSIEREATIEKILALGNAVKLPGLRKYLEQNLGVEVIRVEQYAKLVGSTVVTAPAFQENVGCFGVPYGLALQGMGRGGLRTNLLPPQVLRDRIIREKKPWAVACASALLLAATVSVLALCSSLSTVDAKTWNRSEQQVTSLTQTSSDLKSRFDQSLKDLKQDQDNGQNLVGNIEGRYLWLELLKAINVCLPHDDKTPAANPGRVEVLKPINERTELQITELTCQRVENLGDWYNKVYLPASKGKQIDTAAAEAPPPEDAQQPPADPNAAPADANAPGGAAAEGGDAGKNALQGPGFIVTLKGRHFHNYDHPNRNQGAQFVRDRLVGKLESTTVLLPNGTPGGMENVNLKDLGLRCPALINPGKIQNDYIDKPSADTKAADDPAAGGAQGGRTKEPVLVFNFEIQCAWQPTPRSARQEKKAAAAKNDSSTKP